MYLNYIQYWEKDNFTLSVEYMAKQVTGMHRLKKVDSVYCI